MHAGEVGDDDQRRRRCVSCVHLQVLVGIRHVDADEEDEGYEQDRDAPVRPANRRRDRLLRVTRLARTHTHQLRALEAEAGRDEHRPESDKLADGAVDEMLREQPRMHPVLEAKVPLVADARVHTDGENNKADDGDDLDAGEPHLQLAVPADRQEVDGREDGPEHGDPDGDAQAIVPILDD